MSEISEAQRYHIIELLEQEEDLPLDYKYLLFPSERQEYELVYANKEQEEDILAETMALPLQPIRTFGNSQTDSWHNRLIFGDNLQAMKTLLALKKEGKLVNADGSLGVKLIYIDPPFATKQEFRGNQDQKAYQDKLSGVRFLEFLRKRLVFLKALLADTGSIFIHLDTRRSHYIKVLADEIFGEQNFKSEIIWYYRKYQMRKMRGFANNSERLLWYVRSQQSGYTFNPLTVPLDRPKYLKRKSWDKELGRTINVRDDEGNLIYDEYQDEKVDDVWDIPFMGATSPERTGYPTQKPETVIDQVIRASSNPGDIVLDAFAGSGTTLAVAEKLKRRWIGIDCGKLAIYTIQKRMLNLKSQLGSKGSYLQPKPFTLYNAGLYDFSQLRELSWEGWRFFALNLFQCRDELHKVGGIELDGYRGGADVLVFNHTASGGVVLDYGFIDDLHTQIGSKLGARFFIIAPAASVTFLEDYIDKASTRYYILRIPYSVINELHNREFEAITQPVDEMQVNETVEAVGFDFIRQPKVECEYFICSPTDKLFDEAVMKIKTFKSEAMARGVSQKRNLETLSMVLVDYDYLFDPMRQGKESPPSFELDAVFYGRDLEKIDWEVRIPLEVLGTNLMLIYIDIYGNEYAEIKAKADFVPSNQDGGERISLPQERERADA